MSCRDVLCRMLGLLLLLLTGIVWPAAVDAQSRPKVTTPLTEPQTPPAKSKPKKTKPSASSKKKPKSTGGTLSGDSQWGKPSAEEESPETEGDYANLTSKWGAMMGLIIPLVPANDAVEKGRTANDLLKEAKQLCAENDFEAALENVNRAVDMRTRQLDPESLNPKLFPRHPLVLQVRMKQLELKAAHGGDGEELTLAAADLFREAAWQRHLFQVLAVRELGGNVSGALTLLRYDLILPIADYLTTTLTLARDQPDSLRTASAAFECALNSPVTKIRSSGWIPKTILGDKPEAERTPEESFRQAWRVELQNISSARDFRISTHKAVQKALNQPGVALDEAEERKFQVEAVSWWQNERKKRRLPPADPEEFPVARFATFPEFRARYDREWHAEEMENARFIDFNLARIRIAVTALGLLGQREAQGKFVSTTGVKNTLYYLIIAGKFTHANPQNLNLPTIDEYLNWPSGSFSNLSHSAEQRQDRLERERLGGLHAKYEEYINLPRHIADAENLALPVKTWAGLMNVAEEWLKKDEFLRKNPFHTEDWVGIDELKRHLPSDSCLVMFRRLASRSLAGKAQPDEDRYLAWVLPAEDAQTELSLVDLGPAAAIDDAIGELVRHLKHAPAELQDDPEAASAAVQACLKTITDLVWRPLQPLTNDQPRLLIQPDHELWEIPWPALMTDSGNYLIEERIIQQIADARSLTQPLLSPEGNRSLIVSDPDYAARVPIRRMDPMLVKSMEYIRELRAGDRARIEELKKYTWSPLQTKREAAAGRESLRAILGVEPDVLSGAEATEEEFYHYAKQRPRVIVISTHGFFFTGLKTSVEQIFEVQQSMYEPLVAAWGKEAVLARLKEEAFDVNSDVSMANCGLVLAGANHQADAQTSNTDGILTGQELWHLEVKSKYGLPCTDLVVLSACETGLGKRGSGSLRSSLHSHCDIPAVVATLWQIPDVESAELMKQFWAEIAAGKDVAAALANSQRAMIDLHRESPDRYGDAHPFFWAAYGMSGTSIHLDRLENDEPRPPELRRSRR